MVLKAVMSGVSVGVHFKRHLRMKLLLYANFKIVLRISANVAYALSGISRVIADKACQQGVFNRRRREQPVIRGVHD